MSFLVAYHLVLAFYWNSAYYTEEDLEMNALLQGSAGRGINYAHCLFSCQVPLRSQEKSHLLVWEFELKNKEIRNLCFGLSFDCNQKGFFAIHSVDF